jgi:aspartyl aminopeptidase
MKFLKFLSDCPTAWHAVKEIGRQLKEAGFHPLSEKEAWKLEPHKTYFVEREGALIAAFRLPKNKPLSAILLASHTDSPALKVKPEPDILNKEIAQIGTEVYGGPLLHSWFDRDLSIAGRIETDKGTQLVYLTENPLIIPQLAIHLDRSIHEKGILVHKQDHLKAILAIKGGETLEKLLKKHVSFETLYAFDLLLVPTEKPSLVGSQKDMIAGYRLDNLSSAYPCLEAILQSQARADTVQIAVFWDHEEIGSVSSTGAGSLFVDQLLDRIGIGLGQTREHFYQLKASSLILSADVGHAWNPNFTDKYDPQNSPLLGGGVMIKFNAQRKYASDSASAASLHKIAEKHKLKIQRSANRSDIPSGSTVGPIMSANTGIPTIDLGVPLWAMHSTREIIAASDLKDLEALLTAACNEWKPL